MELGIAGRCAAVAAASKGLGFGVAQSLANEGVRVAICGRDRDSIEDAAARIGNNAVAIVADVSSVEGATGFVRDATTALGRVDILVPNAGGPPPGDFAHTTVDQYLDAFELNCRGAIAMCYEAVPAMRAQKWGRVLAITSIAVRQPIATLILSNTARAGLTGFLRTLAREVAADGVTVNSLLPGLHLTERTKVLHDGSSDPAAGIPAGRMGDAADFGQVAAFLCSESANFVTGVALQVDGGQYAALL
ncbi:MAG TPA: SDR family oxidoreductase [Acidimicrobiia bacterium]|nr:SDR family oxidoreductase [Acidimicrobiia bacterium]